MSVFSLIDALDGSTQRLFTPCHSCGHAHHCSKEICMECECKECDCDNCRARKSVSTLDKVENKRFI